MRPGSRSRKRPFYLCSYPKSGRTWLRFILANYVDLAFGLGIGVDFRSLFAVSPNEGGDPVRGLPAYRYFDDERIPLVVSSHSPYKREFVGKDVVFVVRSPYDVLVSCYFHDSRQWRSFDGDLKAYLRDEKVGIARLIHYVNSWADPLLRQRSLVLSYEQLQDHAESAVEPVLAFLGLPILPEVVAEAVFRSSFERLRDLELAEGIPGHTYDRADPNARRIRAGRVGGFAEHLDRDDQEFIQTRCRRDLTPAASGLLSRLGVMPEERLAP